MPKAGAHIQQDAFVNELASLTLSVQKADVCRSLSCYTFTVNLPYIGYWYKWRCHKYKRYPKCWYRQHCELHMNLYKRNTAFYHDNTCTGVQSRWTYTAHFKASACLHVWKLEVITSTLNSIRLDYPRFVFTRQIKDFVFSQSVKRATEV